MTEVTPERLGKLPKWAQDHIDSLEVQLADALAQGSEGVTDKTRLRHTNGNRVSAIPEDDMVIFRVNAGGNKTGEVAVRFENVPGQKRGGKLRISSGLHLASIRPLSKNSFFLELGS